MKETLTYYEKATRLDEIATEMYDMDLDELGTILKLKAYQLRKDADKLIDQIITDLTPTTDENGE